jgi:hypothetical protein
MRKHLQMSEQPDSWYCPAYESVIPHGLCWEFCFANKGGPTDTAERLIRWISESGKFKSLAEFHQICDSCEHCQRSR